MKYQRSSKSITLIELMISVAILAVVSGAIVSVLSEGERIWRSDMLLMDLQQQLRGTMRGMVTELRQSNQGTISLPAADGGRVDFFIPDSPNRISYYLVDEQLMREHPVGAVNGIMSDVDNLSFCCWHAGVCDADCSNSHLLEIRMQATRTLRGESFSFPLREQIRLRNE